MTPSEIAAQLTAALISGALKDTVGNPKMDEARRARVTTNTFAIYRHLKSLMGQIEDQPPESAIAVVRAARERVK